MLCSNIARNSASPSFARRERIEFQRRSPCPSDEGAGGIDAIDAKSSSDESRRIEQQSGKLFLFIAVGLYSTQTLGIC